ncbi:ATP-binding SpoIIE family protein phosphatase [Streptacidiphilus anmyonensis]|uniref:ATP-binding SpoIIE family protein phosphatase n=1 Tax=Streptacidiphilus anmyonensis TaxID=405782 RepID=UPI0007C8262A|nr:SpoIIE family protein phosphatase [Streptacidiphilus anmyonensis]
MTEESFAASEAAARRPAPSAPEVVALARLAALVVDSDGRLTHWNLGAEELFGHRRNDVLDRTTTGLLPLAGKPSGDALDHLDDLVDFAPGWAGELTVTDRDGRRVEVCCWAWRTVEPSGRGMLVLAADAHRLSGSGLRIALGEQQLTFAADLPGGGAVAGAARVQPVLAPCGSRGERERAARRLAQMLPRIAADRRRALLTQLVAAGTPALRLDAMVLPVAPVPDSEPPAGARTGAQKSGHTTTSRTVAARASATTAATTAATAAGAPARAQATTAGSTSGSTSASASTSASTSTDAERADATTAEPGRGGGRRTPGRLATEQPEHGGRAAVPSQARSRAVEEVEELEGEVGGQPSAPRRAAADDGPFSGPPTRASVSLGPGAAAVGEELDADPVNPQLLLLSDVGARIGTTLDLDRTVHEVCDVVIPGIADFACVELRDRLITDSEPPRERPDDETQLRRVACSFGQSTLPWKHLVTEGSLVTLAGETPSGYALQGGRPVLVPRLDPATAEACALGRGGPGLTSLFEGRSMLTLPLTARGTVLGVLTLLRDAHRPAFDEADASYLRELAARAALSIDNARLHRMEARTAITLQRSMLPSRPPRVPGVQVAHRYLPGDRRAEVGGDWFDAVQLPGSRVALVVGDVMGHGLHSAVAMGRFRTAMQTLAALDLPPGQILRHLDNLSQRLGDDHLATCLYAVYDPIARTCTIASAGHVPPVLVHPDGRGELLEIPSGAPIGVGGVPFASKEVKVTDGSMLVLCTDGLVEMRGGDIGDGLAALCGDIVDPRRSPEEVCDTVLERLHTEDRGDDLALLIARFDGIPPQDVISWSLALDASEVRRARSLVHDQLTRWGLAELSELTELLVSELVTNALRVAKGSVELQLMRVGKLLVEVSDDDHNLPSLEPSELLDEEGRGLGLVSQLASRWGTSRKAVGKVVWFELPLPVQQPVPPLPPLPGRS